MHNIDPAMVRRKLHGLLLHLWPQLLQFLQQQGWEGWVDRILGFVPTIARLVGLPLSLPPGNWRDSLPSAAAALLASLSDEQLTTLAQQAQFWANWLADPSEGGETTGADST